tara:strand:- start:402 stop:665 length:264 start_codon:yes stop_codon:yes gene_type:complete
MKENKLIAEFMDVNLIEGQLGDYHTSWDWLMPVVQKIESLGYVFTIQGGKAEFGEMISKPQCFTSKDKISSTYDAVVEFINQLNKES